MHSKGESSEDTNIKDTKTQPLRRRSSIRVEARRKSWQSCSLLDVLEEVNAEMDPGAIHVDEGVYSDLRRRRAYPSTKGPRRRRASLESAGGPRQRRASLDSDDTPSEVSLTFSSASQASGRDSVNVMDFGVDNHRRASFLLGAPFLAGVQGDLSQFVDSSGFMAWDNASDASSTRGDRRPSVREAEPRRRGSCDTDLSLLVDSVGFLDWERCTDDGSCQAAADVEDGERALAARDDQREGASEGPQRPWRIEDYENPSDAMPQHSGSGNILSKVLGHRLPAKMSATKKDARAPAKTVHTRDITRGLLEGRPDQREAASESPQRPWRIEDYEHPTDAMPKHSGSGNILSKVLGHRLPAKMSATKKDAGAPTETVLTRDIKRCLLEGRPGAAGAARQESAATLDEAPREAALPSPFFHRSAAGLACSAGPADASRRNAAFRPFFGPPGAGGPAGAGAGPWHRPRLGSYFGGGGTGPGPAAAESERRINGEDGVDIGELRRELRGSGSHEGKARKKFNKVFF